MNETQIKQNEALKKKKEKWSMKQNGFAKLYTKLTNWKALKN